MVLTCLFLNIGAGVGVGGIEQKQKRLMNMDNSVVIAGGREGVIRELNYNEKAQ